MRWNEIVIQWHFQALHDSSRDVLDRTREYPTEDEITTTSHSTQFPAKSRERSTSCSSVTTPRHVVVEVVWHLGNMGLASYLGRYRLLKTLLIVLPIVFPPCILLASASSKADWVTEASARARLETWKV